MSYRNYAEYQNYIEDLNRRKHDVDKHHVLPIGCYGPNIPENIAQVLMADHRKIHQTLDIASRYFTTLTRKQRMLENGHIVLTVDDIEWRAEIQRNYFDWVHKLPSFMQEMHEVTMENLAMAENNKLYRLTNDKMELEFGDTLKTHWLYVDIQKEISKAIYTRLKSNLPIVT